MHAAVTLITGTSQHMKTITTISCTLELHHTIWIVWAYSHVDIDGQQGPSKYTRYHDAMAVWNRWTGLMDWTTGLEYWTGILEWNTGMA